MCLLSILDSGSNDTRVSNFQRSSFFFDLARVRCYAWGIDNPHHEQRQICVRTLASSKNGIHSTRYGPTHVSVPVLVPSATWNLRVAVRTPEDAWSRCIDDGIQGCKSNALMTCACVATSCVNFEALAATCWHGCGDRESEGKRESKRVQVHLHGWCSIFAIHPFSTSYVFFEFDINAIPWSELSKLYPFMEANIIMTGEVLGPTGLDRQIVWGPDRKRQGRRKRPGRREAKVKPAKHRYSITA
ncbi:hypothetical protein EDB89DRAFT_1948398 [Lactarius sanguifluus]|nr:hypothetical protein EDB89DRAFT_1948398 [Lactarius sanguifluus]